MESDIAARHGLAVSVYFCCHVYSGTTDSVRVFQMETTSAACLGLAVVYSGTPNFVKLFAVEPWVQICFIITMTVLNSLNVKNICGISLSYGVLLIHSHPDGVVTA